MLRVIDHWNRWSKKCCGFSILGNNSKNQLDTALSNLLPLTCFEQGGWGRHPPDVPSSFSCSVIFIKLFKRAKPISVAVEMKHNTGVERQNIFVCIHRQVCLFVPLSFLMTAWEEGRDLFASALFSWVSGLSAINIEAVYGFIVSCVLSLPWQQRWGYC